MPLITMLTAFPNMAVENITIPSTKWYRLEDVPSQRQTINWHWGDRGVPFSWFAPCGLKTNGTVYLNTQIYCQGQPLKQRASFLIIDGQASGTLYPPSYNKKYCTWNGTFTLSVEPQVLQGTTVTKQCTYAIESDSYKVGAGSEAILFSDSSYVNKSIEYPQVNLLLYAPIITAIDQAALPIAKFETTGKLDGYTVQIDTKSYSELNFFNERGVILATGYPYRMSGPRWVVNVGPAVVKKGDRKVIPVNIVVAPL